MKKRSIVSVLCLMLVFLMSIPTVSAQNSDELFVGDMRGHLSNFTANVQPDTSTVSAVYNTYDATRGNSVKIDVPANTCYCAVANMESVSTTVAPVVVVDFTVLLTETNAQKQIILNTSDEMLNSQPISLLTMTSTGALMLGDTTFGTDEFKFGTWANGHYNIKVYYFAKLGKVGVNIQKLKYAAGTPVDKEWMFTADALKSKAINNVSYQINNTASGTSSSQLFKLNVNKVSESDVPESILNDVYPKPSEDLFVGDMKGNFSNFSTTVQPDTSTVSAKYNTYDSNRGSSVKIDVPANTTYYIESNTESLSADDNPILAADLTVLLTETSVEKEVILNTHDEMSNSQAISLLKITNKGALKIGDNLISTDYFKFGTWANGHYRLKVYYFAKLGKVGVNIQRLKYAAGTPVDKEWTFTGEAPECDFIDSVSYKINNGTNSAANSQLFKFNLSKFNEFGVAENIINSQRIFNFDDLASKTIKNHETSGFHTSYYGWYTQNTSADCNVAYAEEDGRKTLKMFSDGTKYLDLLKYFDLSLGSIPVIEADMKIEEGSVVRLSVDGPACSDGKSINKTLVRFDDGKANLVSSVEIPGFEYGKWFRVSVYVEDTVVKAKLVNLDTGVITEAEAEFDYANTMKYINTFRLTPVKDYVSEVYVDNISFSEKNVHRVVPEFENGSTLISDEVTFASSTFNIDKSKSFVKLNGKNLDLSNIITDEFNKVRVTGLKQNTDYILDYKFSNYWGDEVEGVISVNTGTFYDFAPLSITNDGSVYTVSANGNIATSTGNEAKLVIAVYENASNKLLAVNIANIEESAIKADYSSSLTLTEDYSGCTIKAFLWTDECEPICAPANGKAE